MLPITQRQYSWVRSVESCPNTSIGVSINEKFTHFGQSSHTRNNEDRYYNGSQHNLQLCMVLDGHDGDNAVEYAKMSLAGHLLSNELPSDDQQAVLNVINDGFRRTEQYFFREMDDLIGRRLALKAEISQRPGYDTKRTYPHELERLDAQIKGGTTVVLSFICDNQLYTANIGDSRAVLCQERDDGQIVASQLSDDHNVFNPQEQKRLHSIGINIDTLLQHRRLGPFQVTRSIGDYSIKGGYHEIDVLRSAREEPGSCTPFINGPWNILELERSFLILMSDGLYEAYGYCIGTRNPPEVHTSLGNLVVDEMRIHKRMDHVSQAVVNRVKEQYKEAHRRESKDGKLDDMTLIIQNLSYPMTDLMSYTDQIDAAPSPSYTTGPSGGVFVAEPSPTDSISRGMGKLDINTTEHEMEKLRFYEPSPSSGSNRPPVELTEDEIKAGTFIKPYILFPSDFPFDISLDSL